MTARAVNAVCLNGDSVGYVTIAYRCSLPSSRSTLETAEVVRTRRMTRAQVRTLDRHDWIDRVLIDAAP